MVPYLPNPLSLSILLVAPLWTFWDPTWNAIRKEQRKMGGRSRSKVECRQMYIVSSFIVERLATEHTMTIPDYQISQGAAFLSRVASALVLHLELFSSHLSLLYLCLSLTAFIVSMVSALACSKVF